MSAVDLNGKVAVVTGAGQGLGRAYAVALARAGASVIVNDLDARAADETVAMAGARTLSVSGDVGDGATADALVAKAVQSFGQLDVMVTNAGVLRDGVLWKMTDDDFDLVIRTHLRGTFQCARAANRPTPIASEGSAFMRAAPSASSTDPTSTLNSSAAICFSLSASLRAHPCTALVTAEANRFE